MTGKMNILADAFCKPLINLCVCVVTERYGFGVVRRTFSKARYARKFYHYFSHMMGQQQQDDVHSFDAEIALMASLSQMRSTVTFCGINRELNYTSGDATSADAAAAAEAEAAQAGGGAKDS